MRRRRAIWFVLSFVFFAFVWAGQAFSQTCTLTDVPGGWCPFFTYPAGTYPDCYCESPPNPPQRPETCNNPCDIMINGRCEIAACPLRSRPRAKRNIDDGCLAQCRREDCRGLTGRRLDACVRQCRAECTIR